MVQARGNISYDSLTRSYRVFEGSQYEPGRTVNYFFINRRTCAIETAGPVITGLNFDYVGMECTGEIEYMIVPDSTELDLNLAIDFLFDENSLAMIADSIIASGARGIDLNHPRAIALLRHYLGEAGESALREDIGTYGAMKKLPEQLMHTFLLYDVKLFWSSVSRSYVSRGPLGVISLGDKPVLRYLNGYVELLRRRSGDGLSIYLEIAPLKWYFFDYRNGLMQTISSDDEYNAKVSLMKDSKRKSSKPGAETDYEYMISTRSKAIDFLRRMDALSR
jgi:hypothetical protein